MAMHVMFRRDLNELKVSRKAERRPGPADVTCRMTGTSKGSVEKMKTQEKL